MDLDHDFETMMGKLGDWGRYQCFQFLLHMLSAVTAGMHMLSLVTVAAVPEHRCAIPGLEANGTSLPWDSPEVLAAIPMKDGTLDSCHIIQNNLTVACNAWVYNTTYRSSSMAMDWGFVCDHRWMGALAQCSYMLGVFTGAITLGGLADKVGRKKVYCWSGLLQLILGVGVAFIPEYWSFLVIRYLFGIFGSAGGYITGFVLTMEIVGVSKRTACGVAFQGLFAIGVMMVAGWGALIADAKLLQIVYGLHAIIFIPHWWLMDESPRWLWTQGRVREAVAIVEKALKFNKSTETLDVATLVSRRKMISSCQETSAGMMDLFRTPYLRRKTLNMCLCWFANSIVYYGLSLSSGKLAGNPYLMLFLLALVEIPSYISCVYLMDILGRRSMITVMMLIGGLACIIAAYLTQQSTESTTVVLIGKFFISGSFAIIYNYTAELFPTVVRNSAIGLGSMCARLAGALTPMITLLDSFDPKIPAVVFGVLSMLSGFLVMFLPETNGEPMPQSLADGERFGIGDTCFSTCLGGKREKKAP